MARQQEQQGRRDERGRQEHQEQRELRGGGGGVADLRTVPNGPDQHDVPDAQGVPDLRAGRGGCPYVMDGLGRDVQGEGALLRGRVRRRGWCCRVGWERGR